MQILKTPPPIYLKIRQKFHVKYEDIVIAYYPNIHVREGFLPQHKIRHEMVHINRQKEIGVVEWWDKYLKDDKFRLTEELEAFKEEIKFIQSPFCRYLESDKKLLVDILLKEISGKLYGNLLTYEEAKRILL